MIDAAIQSSHIITPSGIREGYLLINNGKFEEILTELPSDIPVTDAKDSVVMPGIVDPHVHINEPGRTEWEGFDTATKAALAGGICSLVEMPLNSSPVTTSTAALKEKIKATVPGGNNQLHTNCGFWGGIIPGNEHEIEPLIEMGVPGFKAFLTHSGIDEFPNVTEIELRQCMPILAKYQLPLLVHCELESPVPVVAGNPQSYQAYLQSRPRKWEDDAIAMMIRLCEEFNCRTHIVHLSSSGSIEQIQKAKQKGLPLTVETAQHYLYFDAENIPDGRTEFKCAPPIREKENNERLWQALIDGSIDFVATDHSPAPAELKELNSGDLMKAWGGIASLQFSLPALWTKARKRNIDYQWMAKWLCEMPAYLPGLQKTKGSIEKGKDADLVIWNPEKSLIVKKEMIQHKHKITPYLGKELFGVVGQTWLGGKKVYENGKYLHLREGQILYNYVSL